jgi:tetratricopeptide (TPR) repeat protein
MLFNYIKKTLFLILFSALITATSVNPAQSSGVTKTIILLPFVNEGNASYSWIATGIYDYLERAIRSNQSCGNIPNKTVAKIADALKIKTNVPLEPEAIARLTKLTGADEAVSFRYFYSDGSVNISFELLDTSGNIKKSFSVIAPFSRIYDIEESIYRGIVNGEKPEIKPLPMVKQTVVTKVKKRTVRKTVLVQKTAPSTDPFEWYSKALELSTKNPETAISLFVKTLRYDPENSSALIAASKVVQDYQNNIDGALGFLLRADKIFVKRGETSTSRYSILMIRIADIYFHKKKVDKPQLFIGRAFDSWKSRKKSFPNEYASFLYDLGCMTLENGDSKKALEYFASSRAQYEKSRTTDNYCYALTLSSIGETHLSLSEASSSLNVLTKAEEAFSSIGLVDNSDFANVLHLKGKAYFQLGKLSDAENCFSRAKKIYSESGNKEGESAVEKTRKEMTANLRYNYR